MFPNTDSRSNAIEIMDDLEMEGELLEKSLVKLDWINAWLGGDQVTLSGIKKMLKGQNETDSLTIIDLGCGSGNTLRLLAKYFRKTGRPVQLIGIDANEFTINFARKNSIEFPEISYICGYVPSDQFNDLEYDIMISTLFLHHLTDVEIHYLLEQGLEKASIGILVNDLHRSKMAYVLYSLLTLFISNKMIRQDGKTSILRGFKKKDLLGYSIKLKTKQIVIVWCWAFRYQWILYSKQK